MHPFCRIRPGGVCARRDTPGRSDPAPERRARPFGRADPCVNVDLNATQKLELQAGVAEISFDLFWAISYGNKDF
jgi:hypothetical protein